MRIRVLLGRSRRESSPGPEEAVRRERKAGPRAARPRWVGELSSGSPRRPISGARTPVTPWLFTPLADGRRTEVPGLGCDAVRAATPQTHWPPPEAGRMPTGGNRVRHGADAIRDSKTGGEARKDRDFTSVDVVKAGDVVAWARSTRTGTSRPSVCWNLSAPWRRPWPRHGLVLGSPSLGDRSPWLRRGLQWP
jgi:hypothetical protein